MLVIEKSKDLRSKSISELKDLIQEVDKYLFSVKNKLAIEKSIERPDMLTRARRYKARLITICKEIN